MIAFLEENSKIGSDKL